MCKQSCWWVKVLIFFLKARLSCQRMLLAAKNEKWTGQWMITNTAESWFACQWMIDRFIYKQQFLANFSTNDSLGEALLVISKETVKNSWDISGAILGHKYHQNHSNRSSEWNQHLQQKWLIQSVNGWVDQLFYWHQDWGSYMFYWPQKSDLDQMSERSICIWKDTYIYIYIWLQVPSVANFGFIHFIYIYIYMT